MKKFHPIVTFRRPKGHKRALINEERSIPPDEWVDLEPCKENYTPYKACKRMFHKGVDRQTIIHKLVRKFHISHQEATVVVARTSDRFSYSKPSINKETDDADHH